MSQKRFFERVLSIDWLATNGTHSYNNLIIFILILFNQNLRSITLMFYLQGHFLKTFIEFPVDTWKCPCFYCYFLIFLLRLQYFDQSFFVRNVIQ